MSNDKYNLIISERLSNFIKIVSSINPPIPNIIINNNQVFKTISNCPIHVHILL